MAQPQIPDFINDPELGVVEMPRPDMPKEEIARIERETKEKIDEVESK